MIEIFQGESVTFTLSGSTTERQGFSIRAALRPSATMRKKAAKIWEDIDIVDGVAVWSLTGEDTAHLPLGKYAIEVALRDVNTQQDIKDITTYILSIKDSYTI